MPKINFETASKEELIAHIQHLNKKISGLDQEKSSLRGKLSTYHASIAEAYLLDGFEEKEDSSSSSEDHLKVQSKPKKKKDKSKPKSSKNKQENAEEDEIKERENDEEMMKKDTISNKVIAELRGTILDLQQQLAESRRYNMQLDSAHQTSIRESKKLKNELSKHVPTSESHSFPRNQVTPTTGTTITTTHGHNEEEEDDGDDDKGIVDVNAMPSDFHDTIANASYLDETNNQRRPKIRKLGVNPDGFEEYDMDFEDENEDENELKRDENGELRQKLLNEQLQVEELKKKRKESVLLTRTYKQELKKN